MKTTVAEAIRLLVALKSCDGHNVVVDEGEKKKSIYVLFECPFDVRLAIAENIETLQKVMKVYEAFRNDLVKNLAKDNFGIDPKADPAAFAEFNAKDQEQLNSEIEVDVRKLKRSDLEKTAFPPSVLAELIKIME